MNYPLNEILVEGMEFHAYHGFYPEEQKIGCRYTVDLRITTPLATPGKTDSLADTINYEEVYIIVRDVMSTPSQLIEHVAQRIIDAVKSRYPQITHLDLTLYKYNPPLGGPVERVGIHLAQ